MIAIYKPKQFTHRILTAELLLSATFVFSCRSFAGTIVNGCTSTTDNYPDELNQLDYFVLS